LELVLFAPDMTRSNVFTTVVAAIALSPKISDRVFPARRPFRRGLAAHRRLHRATATIVGTSPARPKPTFPWSRSE
jgi:hypothetical protein